MRILFFLLIVAAGFLVWRAWRKDIERRAAEADPQEKPAVKTMVQCRHCGVYLPQDEAVSADGFHYCSVEHRKNDRSRPGAS